ncbi:hypothetical protein AGABI2DRAFT_75272 [Agaricus bisporus var. bisporus H97]|uniref:hypothetical protein n=1 Tax=Agaricus bisporus var. bisporus (strain H97 / ATCC MYA-4626 / FGSC 10389) TaxID=936046 RepID=UPI00029F59D9|nr:hypothetical protein AGABI2DRAFT_75272 [Agaricus bisporus var. bisporus H97]EKV44681.1 hypothetical protein AGABI2DRAFT_75272 [Agaricus bisporus var. bisporus H97]
MEIDPSPNEGTKTIYLAGACTKPNTNDARAGSGISSTDLHLQLSLRTPGIQTLFAAELYGVKSSLECANNFQKIKLVSTSKRLLKALTSDFKTWEDQGWIEDPNSDLIKQVVNRLRIRKAPTLLELLEDTSNGMNEAKSLAKRACNLQQEAETNPPLREEYHPSGAKLQSITQAIAYKLLLNNKAAPESKTSKISVQKIQEDIEEKRGYKPTSQKIWHQLKRSKNCLRKHKEFIYKAIKGTYYIGNKWEHAGTDDMRTRALCQHCKTEESMDHILTKCKAPGRETVWKLASIIWKKKYRNWTNPNIGEILGIASTVERHEKGTTNIGKTRLFHILVSECSYLIWNLRCERVIKHSDFPSTWNHNDTQIKNRLLHRLNSRFRLDCILTSSRKFNRKAIRENLVIATWSGILTNESPNDGPKIWLRKPGVLVGI